MEAFGQTLVRPRAESMVASVPTSVTAVTVYNETQIGYAKWTCRGLEQRQIVPKVRGTTLFTKAAFHSFDHITSYGIQWNASPCEN